MSDMSNEITHLRSEFLKARLHVQALAEACVYTDSLGIRGSEFEVCAVCGGQSSPGMGNFAHKDNCAVAKAEDNVERWSKEYDMQIEEMEQEITVLESEIARLKAMTFDTVREG